MIDSFHSVIDARLLELVRATVRKIDADPKLRDRIRKNLKRWSDPRMRMEWQKRLELPWSQLRKELLADGERGAALRQDAPLGGILSSGERMRIMRQFAHDTRAA